MYQFWIHTEAIGRLPWLLELVLNTPSHHRVHHRPPGNCNYAGVLIIWDRIFCSFISEYSLPVTSVTTKTIGSAPLPAASSDETAPATGNAAAAVVVEQESHRGVLYGLAKPLETYDPVYANLSHFIRVVFGASKSDESVAHTSDSSSSSSYNNISVTTRLWQILCFIPKWRIHKPWRIARSWGEFMPDVLHDWQQEELHMQLQAQAGQTGPLCYLQGKAQRCWEAFWDLPPEVTATHEVKARPNERITLSSRDEEFLRGRKRREAPQLSALWAWVVFGHFLATLVVSYLVLELSGDAYFRVFKSIFWLGKVDLHGDRCSILLLDSESIVVSDSNVTDDACWMSASRELGADVSAGDNDVASAWAGAIGVSLVCIASVISLQTIKLHY